MWYLVMCGQHHNDLVFYGSRPMMLGRYCITFVIYEAIYDIKKLLTEDDWLKDLQGDVYRCMAIICSFHMH
jgi:hypothetical protein